MIREVRPADWEALRDVRLRALAASPEAFLETHANASAFPAERWRQRATPGDDDTSFVLEHDGRFDGMVGAFTAGDPENVFLVAMWVAREHRGTGVARELVAQVVEWARRRGARRVALSVEAENARAAAFYARCGFVETPDPPPFPYEPTPGSRFFVCEL